MNLILFTPTVKTSAIARMACLLTRELLRQEHKVTVVKTENEVLFENEVHDFGAVILPWTDVSGVEAAVKIADAVIYQIGDNYEFHKGAIEWLFNVPGVVCLHDFFLGHLFWGWSQSRREQANAVLQTWYDADVANQFFSFPDSQAFVEGAHNVSPMTEWICAMALGVITHSNWGCDRVLNSCPGSVRVVPLAYDAPEVLLESKHTQIEIQDKFRILTIGHVNPNKRVESVIQVLGNSPMLRQHSVYQLVGAIEPSTANELSALALKHGVNLIISGEVDDITLANAIAESDVISCLRWPSLEAASASAIESMLYGKPIIVTDTGFYQEIPDSCVLKISIQNEINDIQSTLELLFKDQEQRKKIGLQGQEWAKETFTAENYARELGDVVVQAIKCKPTLDAIDYFCSVINRWSGNPEMLQKEEFFKSLEIFNLP